MGNQMGDKVERENIGRANWNCGAFGEWCRKLVQWKLPKIYEGNPNKFFKNGGYDVPTGHLLLLNEAFSSRTG